MKHKKTSTAHQKMSKQNIATKKGRTQYNAKRTISVKMVMYAIVSKSIDEKVQVEIPHLLLFITVIYYKLRTLYD